MSPDESERLISKAVNSLWGIERMAFVSLIKGEGYNTLWNADKSKWRRYAGYEIKQDGKKAQS